MTGRPGRPGHGGDVAVIGAGIVGVATAAFLAGSGVRVRLYERTVVAAAASGRNSGVVQHPFDPILAALYRETLQIYGDLAAGAGSEAPFHLGSEPAGLLALDGAGGAAAERVAAEWAGAYPDTRPELVSGPALAALEPALAPGVVACRLAIGYPVAPASATRAFGTLAIERGAELIVGREARLAVRGGRAVGVEVDGRLEPAPAVVVAAGPWTPAVADASGRWRPIRPIWGVVASVRLAVPPRHVLEEASIDIEPAAGRRVEGVDVADGPGGTDLDFSLVTADGATALGSTFLDDEPAAEALVERLRANGARFVPALADAVVDGVRSCARPVSFDRRPLVGRLPGIDGAYVAAGHGPWGISSGPATARMVADLVLGLEPRIPAALDPARFGPIAG